MYLYLIAVTIDKNTVLLTAWVLPYSLDETMLQTVASYPLLHTLLAIWGQILLKHCNWHVGLNWHFGLLEDTSFLHYCAHLLMNSTVLYEYLPFVNQKELI